MSTGWVWRQEVRNIDVRPRIYSEEMQILTKERLGIKDPLDRSDLKISVRFLHIGLYDIAGESSPPKLGDYSATGFGLRLIRD